MSGFEALRLSRGDMCRHRSEIESQPVSLHMYVSVFMSVIEESHHASFLDSTSGLCARFDSKLSILSPPWVFAGLEPDAIQDLRQFLAQVNYDCRVYPPHVH